MGNRSINCLWVLSMVGLPEKEMINIVHESPMSWEQRWEELRNWVIRDTGYLNKSSLPDEVKTLFLEVHRNFLDAMNELEGR